MTVGLTALWLPILVSAFFVFVASSVLHMATPWHKGDFKQVPNEDGFIGAVRPLAIPPGDYMMPRPASMEEMKSAEFKEKMNKGPVMVLTVMPSGDMGMGRALALWFLYDVVVSIFAGYIAGRALPAGANYLHVFRFAGATAFVGYSLALWQTVIWYKKSGWTVFKQTIDGLIFAFLTAGTFGWLWPR